MLVDMQNCHSWLVDVEMQNCLRCPVQVGCCTVCNSCLACVPSVVVTPVFTTDSWSSTQAEKLLACKKLENIYICWYLHHSLAWPSAQFLSRKGELVG